MWLMLQYIIIGIIIIIIMLLWSKGKLFFLLFAQFCFEPRS